MSDITRNFYFKPTITSRLRTRSSKSSKDATASPTISFSQPAQNHSISKSIVNSSSSSSPITFTSPTTSITPISSNIPPTRSNNNGIGEKLFNALLKAESTFPKTHYFNEKENKWDVEKLKKDLQMKLKELSKLTVTIRLQFFTHTNAHAHTCIVNEFSK